MNFLDCILTVLIVLILAVSKPISKNSEIFGRDSTASLRGLAMLGIMLHHIQNELGLCSPILIQVGYIATGLFFFISGYGNTISLNKNGSSIKWIWNKFLKIYIPFFVVYWFCFICLYAIYPLELPTEIETIKDMVTISLPNQASWFPKIILLCFAVHWLANKLFLNKKIQTLVVFCCIVIYIAVMWKKGFAACWYNSVICYAIGILVSEMREHISTMLLEKRRRIYIYRLGDCI